ncbi:uncharacterized protein LACBIDRAFT_298254 [Laccaria bicolor S238N-H82]|uniref:Predicted protein n=1 Tax=Laccaria bicolor (strain S238N-H82 / ATCC MYA-4686) TaxID=486041 RepID=B0DCK5_LACBS|nr:uncharacterized protein LACBIDRAFT_298254 [Laccaria bicolor S238N-H82]EDR07747.1 predicted protein [Laccaria bicolor S238N-H82]|eukprot:XP_001881536.1 predicted protein [Laccaria bicolor S238N-H82]
MPRIAEFDFISHLLAAFFALDKVHGYRRVFSLEDTSLRHPFAEKERIPDVALYMICFVAPLVIQPLINLLTIRSWWDLHNGTLGLILGLALTGAVTQFTKITVGRPRPGTSISSFPCVAPLFPTVTPHISPFSLCVLLSFYSFLCAFLTFPCAPSFPYRPCPPYTSSPFLSIVLPPFPFLLSPSLPPPLLPSLPFPSPTQQLTVSKPTDIIARCLPPQNATDPIFGLSTDAICTNTDVAIMRDGFRSFPSGHSSRRRLTQPITVSFAGLGFLSFYLAGKLHLFDKRGHAGKAWLSLTPFAGAALVAISRTMDYRHHWHDVLVGSILGTVLAYFSYRQYYPSLSSELSHRPYSPRIKDELDANLHRNDLESPVPMANQQQGPAAHRRQESAVQQQQLTATAQEEDYELEGTAPRPSGPGHLYDVWSEGRKDEV